MRGRGPSLPQQGQARGAGSRHYGANVGEGGKGAGHRFKAAPGLRGTGRARTEGRNCGKSQPISGRDVRLGPCCPEPGNPVAGGFPLSGGPARP